jgi:hypothetical protein
VGPDINARAYCVSLALASQDSAEMSVSLSITQQIYKDLHENGLFRLETADQTYCEDDKLFLADRFVEGTCPDCGYEVSVPRVEQDRFPAKLIRWIISKGRSGRSMRQMLLDLLLPYIPSKPSMQAK